MGRKTKSARLNRSDFVKIVTTFLGSIMGAVMGLPFIGYVISPAVKIEKSETWISLGLLDNYPVGAPTLFNFTQTRVNGWENTIYSYGVYVLRKENGAVNAFSDICTHLACKVKWQADLQEYVCPCHDGHFAIDGYVTKGPPPRPLDQFNTKIEDGVLYIHLMS